VRLVTDLPEPDSPTSAVVLPGRMLKLTSATERIRPSSVSKKVLRWRTSRRVPAGSGCGGIHGVSFFIKAHVIQTCREGVKKS
jgi:hypothetical protein